MELNRNQFMLIGFLLFLLGLQFRLVDTFVLNEPSTRFLAKRSAQAESPTSPWKLPLSMAANGQIPIPAQRTRIRPPRWLSYALLSVGAVLMLHSIAMKKPGG
jgi:hypothetical protein